MGKKLVVVSLFITCLAVYWSRRSPSRIGKIVYTKAGKVQGIISTSRNGREFYEWLGIPYAQPPTANLRFASPQPVTRWAGVIDGGYYRSQCMQVQLYTRTVVGDEDCLYINVHIPKLDEVENDRLKLPVMVWIHGGAFYFMGSGDYRPEYFMDEDVVLVTFNYRLGVFGFTSMADNNIRGNMGLKDQALALKWVNDNIEYFGGDANLITIFGESAGGVSVHYQILSPTTKGLFHKAISQSGVAGPSWTVESAEESKRHTLNVAKTVGCDDTDATKTVRCLRKLTQTQLLEADMKYIGYAEGMKAHRDGHMFRPVVEVVKDEEAFLTEHPLSVVAQGKAHRVPWITGVTADEGLLLTIEFHRNPDSLTIFENDFEKKVQRGFNLPQSANSTRMIEAIRNFYFPVHVSMTDKEKLSQHTKMFSDAYFNFHMNHVVSIQREFSPVHVYYFNFKDGPSLAPIMLFIGGNYPFILEVIFGALNQALNRFLYNEKVNLGVCHGDDLPVLFPMPGLGLDLPKDEDNPDYRFSRDFVKLWVDFAKNKSEMKFRGHVWNKLDLKTPLKYLELSDSPAIINEAFWDRTAFLRSMNLPNTNS